MKEPHEMGTEELIDYINRLSIGPIPDPYARGGALLCVESRFARELASRLEALREFVTAVASPGRIMGEDCLLEHTYAARDLLAHLNRKVKR
jgi:hypothetical protein